uniref:hypothetical protein n=1 Tax=Shewanella sp. TaxID=50422 RepID=UPI0040487028
MGIIQFKAASYRSVGNGHIVSTSEGHQYYFTSDDIVDANELDVDLTKQRIHFQVFFDKEHSFYITANAIEYFDTPKKHFSFFSRKNIFLTVITSINLYTLYTLYTL